MRKPDIKLGQWRFFEVKLEDKSIFYHYIKESTWPVNLWSANFPFIWGYSQSPKRKVLWKIIDGLLVTFIFTNGKKLSLLCLPFGKGDIAHLEAVLFKSTNFCKEWNSKKGYKTNIRTINSAQLDYLQRSGQFHNHFTVKKLRGIERHHSIPYLNELRGKQFESLRRTVNRFYRKYPSIKIREYKKRDYQQVLMLNSHWEKDGGKKYSVIFDKTYFNSILKYSKELDMVVLVAELNGTIVGVNIGGLLPTGQSWGCICKTRSEFEGLSEAIIIHLVREIYRQCNSIEFMNVGSDMGIGGLIRFKEKFKPVLNLARYSVFSKS